MARANCSGEDVTACAMPGLTCRAQVNEDSPWRWYEKHLVRLALRSSAIISGFPSRVSLIRSMSFATPPEPDACGLVEEELEELFELCSDRRVSSCDRTRACFSMRTSASVQSLRCW
jgi:hypothetical protein